MQLCLADTRNRGPAPYCRFHWHWPLPSLRMHLIPWIRDHLIQNRTPRLPAVAVATQAIAAIIAVSARVRTYKVEGTLHHPMMQTAVKRILLYAVDYHHYYAIEQHHSHYHHFVSFLAKHWVMSRLHRVRLYRTFILNQFPWIVFVCL